MATITRYFDVDPLVTSVGFGLMGALEREARKKAEAKARKARRKKYLTLGLSAGAGAVAAPLLAPALGLAGTAATTVGGGGFAGGAAAAVPATAGLLGAGGTLSTAGTIAAGLTGASIGAQAADRFTEGDIGGGFGAIASPIMGTLGRQQARRERREDFDYERSGRMADARSLEGFRTDENIRQALEEQSIRTFGDTRAGATAAERAAAEEAFGAGPRGGEPIGLEDSGMSVPAMGPLAGPPSLPNVPGPSDVPGFKRDWGPAQYRQLAKLEQTRADTVDNPGWIQSHTPEERAMQWHALARARENIRVTTLPDQPKPMTVGPDGQEVPMRLGWNRAPDGGWSYLGSDGKQQHVPPPKGETDPQTPWEGAPTPEAAEALKRADFKAKTHVDETGRVWKYDPKQRDWEPVKEAGDGGGDFFDDTDVAKIAQSIESKSGAGEFSPEAVIEKAEKLVDVKETINDRLRLKAALQKAVALPPMDGIDEGQYGSLVQEAVRIYSRDTKSWPDDVKQAIRRLDARLHPSGSAGLVTGPR